MIKRGVLAVAMFAAVLVGGCGGGRGGSSAPSPVAPETSGPLVPITFTIAVSRAPQDTRRAQYVSPSTQSISGSVTPGSGGSATTATGNCAPPATTCQVQLLAPIGLDSFTLSLYSLPNGTGTLLSTGNTTLQVIAGDSHDVVVTFNGIPATLQLLLTPSTATTGIASGGALEVIARDAGGNIILGPGTFAPAIALRVSDTTGSVVLATSQIADPAGPVTSYQYNGSSAAGSTVTFTASMTGIASATAALVLSLAPPTPSPSPTASPPPSPLPSGAPTPLPTASPTPAPTAPPGYVLLCSYNLQTGAGTSVTNPCASAVRFNSGLPTTIDFSFTNGRQGTLLGGLSALVGGATGWQVYTNGFNPVRITIGAQFPPGSATLVVTDGFGGYYQVAVVGN
jgi:hypothetical protein